MSLVAVISDTHLPRGARRLPEAFLQQLRRADLILHGGDLCAVGFLEELQAIGPPVLAVHGNADEPALKASLPARLQAELETDGRRLRIGMTHNGGPRAGREARLAGRFPGCDAVVYGHSHVPEVARHGRVWILNPGSPTDRRGQPEFTMIVIRATGARFVPKLLHVSP